MLKVFTKKEKKDKRTNLEKEIDAVLDYMDNMSPDSEEYTTIVTNLERLYKAKADVDERKRKISPDTILLVGGGILEILIILNYEKANVITSKAFGRILKGKI
jgi:hypothetical protein